MGGASHAVGGACHGVVAEVESRGFKNNQTLPELCPPETARRLPLPPVLNAGLFPRTAPLRSTAAAAASLGPGAPGLQDGPPSAAAAASFLPVATSDGWRAHRRRQRWRRVTAGVSIS